MRVRVAALIENSQHEILLIQQKKKDSYYWLLPGGGIEFGESAENALKRELKEELSLEMKSASFLLLNESIEPGGKRHLIQLVFLVNVKKEVPELNLNERAITGFGYFSPAAIREMDLRPDIKFFLLEGDFKSAPFIKSTWVSEKKMSLIETISVNTEHKSVPVYLYSDFSGLSEEIAKLPGITSVFLITERSIHSIYSKYLEKELSSLGIPVKGIYIKGGEKSKHIDRTGHIYNRLIEHGADRMSLILAFGGGVVGDFAGFIASTYLRGIRFVQIPTTLLACVDSSVGGKVAVNADFGKNMIGSFYQPEFVFAPLFVLSTLPDREWRCGQAEIIKHALLSGGEYWEKVKKHSFKDLNVSSPILPYLIAESVRFKANVVSNDEKETGLRKILNLGHTTAHAIESVTRYKKYSHGEAVAIGLVTALLISEQKSGLDPITIQETIETLKNYGLPFQVKLKSKELAKHMLHDKKNLGGSIRFVLLKKPGLPVFDVPVESRDIILTIRKQKGL